MWRLGNFGYDVRKFGSSITLATFINKHLYTYLSAPGLSKIHLCDFSSFIETE